MYLTIIMNVDNVDKSLIPLILLPFISFRAVDCFFILCREKLISCFFL